MAYPVWLKFDGVLFGQHGDGTPFLLDPSAPPEGLEDLPGLRVGNVSRARAHGSLAGPLTAETRIVTVTVTILGDYRHAVAAREQLVFATRLRDVETELRFDTGMGERLIRARVIRRSIPTVPQLQSSGTGTATIQFEASDPRVYGNRGVDGTVTVPMGGDVTIGHDGNIGAPWRATLSGPLTNPRVRVGDGDMRFAYTIPSGKLLHLNSTERSAIVDNVSVYGALTARKWTELPSSPTWVQLTATAGSGSMVFSWRDTWL